MEKMGESAPPAREHSVRARVLSEVSVSPDAHRPRVSKIPNSHEWLRRCAIALVAIASACSPEVAPVRAPTEIAIPKTPGSGKPTETAADEPAKFVPCAEPLDDDAQDRCAWRARIRRLARPRWRIDGELLREPTDEEELEEESGGPDDDNPVMACDIAGRDMRIGFEDFDVRFALWIGREAARRVVSRRVRVNLPGLDVSDGDGRTGVFAYPGTLVERSKDTGTITLDFETEAVTISGTIDAGFTDDHYRPTLWTPSDDDVVVREGAAVRVSPDGPVLTRLSGRNTMPAFKHRAIQEHETKDGWARVRLREVRYYGGQRRGDEGKLADLGGIEIIGYVTKDDVQRTSALGGIGLVGIGRWGGSHLVYLDKGATLYDAPDGVAIGRVLKDHTPFYRRTPPAVTSYAHDPSAWIPLHGRTRWNASLPLWTTAAAPP